MFGSSYAPSWPLRGTKLPVGPAAETVNAKYSLLHFIEGFGGERFRVNVQGVASLLGLGQTICAL